MARDVHEVDNPPLVCVEQTSGLSDLAWEVLGPLPRRRGNVWELSVLVWVRLAHGHPLWVLVGQALRLLALQMEHARLMEMWCQPPLMTAQLIVRIAGLGRMFA